MDILKTLALALHNDEDGATATEYIVLLVLVACFVIAIIALFGQNIQDLFNEASKEVQKISVTGYSGTAGPRP